MSTADREIVQTRLLDAPRELVFEAFTNAEHVDRWWGPRGFTTTTESMDVRVGGRWRFEMHHAEYGTFPNQIDYLEIVKPERLVYDHGAGGEPHFHVTITFEARGAQTLLTMTSVFPTAAARDEVVEKYGAIEGGRQTLDRLEEHLAERV